MKYPNGRKAFRDPSGKFRKSSLSDFGVSGICPTCNGFMSRLYDGTVSDRPLNPRLWVFRCTRCTPSPAPAPAPVVQTGKGAIELELMELMEMEDELLP